MANDVSFNLNLSVKDFQTNLNSAAQSVGNFTTGTTNSLGRLSQAFGNDLKSSIDGARNALNQLGGSGDGGMGNLSLAVLGGQIAYGALNSAMDLVRSTIAGSISAYAEEETALNKLAQALKLTGSYSQEAVQSVKDFAANMQQNSKFADENVIAQVAYARSLGLTTKQSQELVTAAANMSATLGGSLEGNVEKLGLTLSGTAGRLTRLIPELKSLTEAQLKNGEAADIINKKYSGAAASELNTYEGRVAKLHNTYNDLQESIGGAIVNSTAFKTATDIISNLIISSTKFFNDHIEAINNITIVLGVATAAFGVAAIGIAAMTVATSGLAVAIYTAMAPLLPWVAGFAAVVGVVVLAIKYFKQIEVAVLTMAKSYVEALQPIETLTNKIFGTNLTVASGAIDAMTNKIKTLKEEIAKEDTSKVKAKEAPVQDVALARTLTKEEELTLKERVINHQNAMNEIYRIDQEGDNSLLELKHKSNSDLEALEIEYSDKTLVQKQEAYQSVLEQRLAQEQADLEAKQANQQLELELVYEHELAKANLIENSFNRKKALQEASDKNIIAQAQLTNKQEVELVTLNTTQQQKVLETSLKNKKAIDDAETSNRKDTLSTIATLSKSSNKELAVIGKAAGITQIAIDTPVAVSKALAAFPPPYNFIAAGLVGTAMAVQAANIAGINFATGGFVPGQSVAGDKVVANVNSGEAILNTEQQKNFMMLANGGGNNNSDAIISRLDSLEQAILSRPIVLMADDNEIARSTSRGVMNGVEIGRSR